MRSRTSTMDCCEEAVLDSLVGDGSRCTLCGKKPQDRTTFGCQHRLCLECYTNYTKVLGDDSQIQCPNGCKVSDLNQAKCSINTEALSPEKDNFCNGQKEYGEGRVPTDMAEVKCSSCESEDVVATACCDECEGFLCDECVDAHKKLRRLMKTHHVVPLGDLMSGKTQFKQKAKRCEVHPEERLSFFCTKCRVYVCPQCVIITHVKPDHECVEMKVAQNNFTNKLTSLVAKCESKLDEMSLAMSHVENERREVRMEIDTLEQIINRSADEVIESVNANRRKLLNEFGTVKDTLVNKIDDIHTANLRTVDRLKSAAGLLRTDDTKTGLTLDHCKADVFFQRVNEILARKPGADKIEDVKEYARRLGFRRTTSVSDQVALIGELFQLSEWEISRQHKLESAVSAMTVFPDGRVAITCEEDDGLVMILTNGSRDRVLDGVSIKHIAALADGRFVIIDRDSRIRLFSAEGQESPNTLYSRPEDLPEDATPVCVTESHIPDTILVAFSEVPACYAYPISGGKSTAHIPTGPVCPQQLVLARDDDGCKIIAVNAVDVVAVDESGSILWHIQEHNATSIKPAVFNEYVLIASLQSDDDSEGETSLTIDRYTTSGELIDSLVQDEHVTVETDSVNLQLIMLNKVKLAVSIGNRCLVFSGPQTLSDIAEDM